MYGLDLFSGIGGITLALKEWIKPLAYCEICPYCQSVLLQRMREGYLPKAPIWDDIRTLSSEDLAKIDIIYGGFPCQDISVAGIGKGLDGERSALFFEMLRLAKEKKPTFLFIENVPAINRKGGLRVVREITLLGYDCRWCVIPAAAIGALHRRERWFLLAFSRDVANTHGKISGGGEFIKKSKDQKWMCGKTQSKSVQTKNGKTCTSYVESCCKNVEKNDSDTQIIESKISYSKTMSFSNKWKTWGNDSRKYWPFESRTHWQEVVSSMGKCSDGVSFRMDRLKALGNSVVPQQVKTAWKILFNMDIQNANKSD